MLKFSEIFEFSKEKFRKIPILKEFEWFEWFEWFGPSPIEPFNSASRWGGTRRRSEKVRKWIQGKRAGVPHRVCGTNATLNLVGDTEKCL